MSVKNIKQGDLCVNLVHDVLQLWPKLILRSSPLRTRVCWCTLAKTEELLALVCIILYRQRSRNSKIFGQISWIECVVTAATIINLLFSMLFVCLQIHTVNPESSPKKERRRSTKRFQKQSLTYCLFKMFFNVLIFVCLFWTRRERSKRLLSIKKISELKEKKSLDLFRSQRYRHISKRFPKVFYSDLFSGLQVSFFLQYLKDRDKGKYSMISGKKIKMKLKKSKKDKQVKYSKSMWFMCLTVCRLGWYLCFIPAG